MNFHPKTEKFALSGNDPFFRLFRQIHYLAKIDVDKWVGVNPILALPEFWESLLSVNVPLQ